MAKTKNEQITEAFNKIRASFTDQYVISNHLEKVMRDIASESLHFGKTSEQIISISRAVDPFVFATFLNTSGASPNLRSVFNTFNNAQLSLLVPEIKIIVRRRTGKDKYVTKVIPIQNLQPKFPLEKSPELSGATMGLKSVDLDLAGDSPETAQNDINATATFFGNTLAVFQEHPEYVDLINPHFTNKDGTGSEVLFQLGWSEPTDPTDALKFSEDQKTALKAQFQTYVMNYTSHNFSFNENGSFILQVDYVSYIDGVMRDANFLGDKSIITDVYPTVKKPSKKLEPNVHESIMNYIKENHEGATGESKKKIYNALANGNVANNINRYKLRLDQLAVTYFDKLFEKMPYLTYKVPTYRMNIDFLLRAIERVKGKTTNHVGRLNQFLLDDLQFDAKCLVSNPRFVRTSEQPIDIAASLGNEIQYVNSAVSYSDDDLRTMKFIDVTTLGKILETFIEQSSGVKSLMREKDVTLVMGTIKISNPEDKSHKKIYSLYDLPIAMSTLKEVIRKMYTSKLKTKVSLRAFITTILHEARKNYMQGDLVLDSGRKLSANSLRSVQMTCSRSSRTKISRSPGLKTLNEGIRSDLRSLDTDRIANLYCIVAGPADDAPTATLDHYVVGAANSIIKKVNYSQVNSATMKARQDDNIVAAFRNSSNLGVIPQLYNAKMDIIGNLNFLPGYVFNLTPTILGVSTQIKDSIIKDLGLMGSFMTLKVNHSFSQDGFTTKLEAYNISTNKYIEQTIAGAKKKGASP